MSTAPQSHTGYMRQALIEAQKMRGRCAPNPAVGAVVVRHQQVIASGTHQGAGHPHAEVVALTLLAGDLTDAVLYVTLEPCCHVGKTPPCTELINRRGIKTVYFGHLDPNPLVAGKGQLQLQQAGVRCEYLPLDEVEQFYHSYDHWVNTRTPYVSAKLALTSTGCIADQQGAPLKITGSIFNTWVHRSRLHSDALLTTVQTIIRDDPALNVRLNGSVIKKSLFIVDAHARLPLTARIFTTAQSITLLHAKDVDTEKITLLRDKGVKCLLIECTEERRLEANQMIRALGTAGVHDLWVEAGSRFFLALHHHRLVQRSFIAIASTSPEQEGLRAFRSAITGNGVPCQMAWHDFGEDSLLEITSEPTA